MLTADISALGVTMETATGIPTHSELFPNTKMFITSFNMKLQPSHKQDLYKHRSVLKILPAQNILSA